MVLFNPNGVSRVIGVEEHFATQALLDGPAHEMAAMPGMGPLMAELLDLGDGRIKAMDEAGVDLAVLSLSTPGPEPLDPEQALELAREANTQLADAVRAHPDRFAGLVALPLSAPEIAAGELARAAQDGFVGVIINGHSQGRYLDDPAFEPVLATAERLDMPIYLHPTMPPPEVIEANYVGNYSPAIAARFAGAGWGWHHETGTHALRMILGGVFDRFPRLQIMLGHHGETIPFLVPRIERNFPQQMTGLDRSVREYLRENFYYTFGGWNWMSMLGAVQRIVGADRIMFSTDYPFVSMPQICEFLEQIEVSQADRELIAHGNAERLLRIPPRAAGA